MITGNTIGAILKNPETIILQTESGSEHTAVMTTEEVEITATVDDVRLGKTVALEDGVKTGEKEIPSYNTQEGMRYIPTESEIKLPLYSDRCQFTKFQALICAFNTTLDDSVATKMVSIDAKTYEVNSTEVLSDVLVDNETQSIDLALINTSGTPMVVRYFTYKEIY